MKNYLFYLVYSSNKLKRQATRKNLGEHTGNCIAVPLDENKRPYYTNARDLSMECCGAVFFKENSDVASSSASFNYLREKCKRISEKQAREIHPKLFEYLEN